MKEIKKWRFTAIIILCVAVGVTARTYRNSSPLESSARTATPQDVTNLERRISLLEQRFYYLESSINRLEQQSALHDRSTTSTNARDPEISLLRGEVETLQRRFLEVECGLVRLDERTLAPDLREARKKAGTSSTDPCRLNADAPLRISTQP
jgi:predicted RNase H-like nuclease (RuvC/YqgF family)